MKLACVVVLITMAITGFAQQAPLPELLDVTYSASGDVSTVTLAFSEPPRFRYRKLNANQLRLTFPNSTYGKFTGRVPLMFHTGNAKSLSFNSYRQDTASVTIALRDNVQYVVHSQPKKNQVAVNLYSSSTARTDDIAAIVKRQIEDAKKSNKQPAKAISPERFFEIQFIPFAASIVISLIGTAGVMFWITKVQAGRRSAAARVTMAARKENRNGVEAILHQAKLILDERSTRLASGKGRGETEEAALALAQKFGRGQGEFRLMRRLESGPRKYAWEKELHASETMEHDTIARAKKLGVGRGEFALASSLRRMHNSKLRKET